jgi:hypothetical protein
MPLWGTRDQFSLTGAANVVQTSATVTGNGTAFLTELDIGDAITIGSTKVKVITIASNTSLTIDPAWTPSTATEQTIAGHDIPKYLRGFESANTFGVDENEGEATGRDSGWVLRTTYTDIHGVSRDKREVIVAFSSITDDEEDVVYPDATITILTQPSNASANSSLVSNNVSFTIGTSIVPSDATLFFYWQEDQGSGFATLTNTGVYSGSNTATLAISDTTGFNGYVYRVILNADGVSANTTSANATLTVTT